MYLETQPLWLRVLTSEWPVSYAIEAHFHPQAATFTFATDRTLSLSLAVGHTQPTDRKRRASARLAWIGFATRPRACWPSCFPADSEAAKAVRGLQTTWFLARKRGATKLVGLQVWMVRGSG